MKRPELETPEDRVAWDLCVELGVTPFQSIPEQCELRFRGYEGCYYMNWARDRTEEVGILLKLLFNAVEQELS